MDQSQIIYSLFEGACPECENDIGIEQVGGIEKFFEDHPHFLEAPNVTHWREPDPEDPLSAGDAIGGIEFKCPTCGARCYIEALSCGDWAV